MSIEEDGKSTQIFWRRFGIELDISSFSYSTYDYHPTGLPSNNRLAEDIDSIYLKAKIIKEDWPTHEGELFGMGSLVYVCPNKLSMIMIEKLKRQKSVISFHDLEIMGAKPMAVTMLDCDCPNTASNLFTIMDILNNTRHGWSVYDSSNSFIIVTHKLVEVGDLPKSYGEMIKLFNVSEHSDEREYFTEIADNLIEFHKSPNILRSISRRLLSEISHYNNQKANTKQFIIDLRWMAHSILEFADYLEGKTKSFGYIRTNSSSEKKELKLVAISRLHNKINNNVYSSSLDD